MIGINNIISYLKRFDKIFHIDQAWATEVITITWQDEVKSILRDYGIDVEYASKLIQCESSWNPKAIHYNKDSVDRGLWQINSAFHPEVSKECSLDSTCSTIEAVRIIKSKGFKEWTCISKELIK